MIMIVPTLEGCGKNDARHKVSTQYTSAFIKSLLTFLPTPQQHCQVGVIL